MGDGNLSKTLLEGGKYLDGSWASMNDFVDFSDGMRDLLVHIVTLRWPERGKRLEWDMEDGGWNDGHSFCRLYTWKKAIGTQATHDAY